MDFDVSMFSEIGSWLLNIGMYVFSLFNFNFGDFEINGLALIIGVCVVCIVCYIVGCILE